MTTVTGLDRARADAAAARTAAAGAPGWRYAAAAAERQADRAWRQADRAGAAALDAEMADAETRPEVTPDRAGQARAAARAELAASLGLDLEAG